MWITSWLKKLRHNKKKREFLSNLKPNEKIVINCPEGFEMIIGELRYPDYPCKVEVISNDTDVHKLWISFSFKKEKILKVLNYSSKELRNYLLFNIYCNDYENKPVKKPLSKEELQAELEKAIKIGNFESAAIINESIKKLQ